MTVIAAKEALLPDGWATDVAVALADDGTILSLADAPGDVSVDILLPAPSNVHSHAFQRAMAGLTETRGPASDSFWTWRQLMFRFLDRLTPEDIEAIAALVQMEMMEAGYAACGEFHYLHHAPGGAPYDNLAETSAAICAAAAQTGIGLTLLPVLYQQGGVDGRPLGPGQIRFGNELDRFLDLHARAARVVADLPPDAVIGVAPHSLRAVTPAALATVAETLAGPLHMHLAEQVAEVEEIEAAYGARPVEWMLEHRRPDEAWCLIHCTQMLPHETEGLAATGAVAGLCPITEASLGDGIFDGVRWLDAGGRIAVGSDSNIRISLAEELRQLEYSQRLRDRARAVLAEPEGSTGARILGACLTGGAQAMGRRSGRIAPGFVADLVGLERTPDMIGRTGDQLIDTLVFATGDAPVREVWSAGRHMVREGHHLARDRILDGYRKCLTRLADAI